MIAPVLPEFQPNEAQQKVRKILERVTGLGVRIIPFQPPVPGMPTTVEYVFKCDYTQHVDKNIQVQSIHQSHDYIKKLVMDVGKLGYAQVSVSLIGRVDGVNNSMYPWTSIRFSNIMGYPSNDDAALASAEEMERNIMAEVQKNAPAQLPYYQRKLGKGEFKDGHADQLGR